jgi:RNA ligase
MRKRVIVWPGATAKAYTGLTLDDLPSQPNENREGFVLRFNDGTRLKYKFDQYVELHRIMTGLTSRKIWEMVSQNISVERAKEWVPDEFYQWMKSVADDLRSQFTEIEQQCLQTLGKVDRKKDRKTQAEFIQKQPHSGIVFRMLDGKDYKEQIWKMVYPPADIAKVSDEAS